jgi:tetratricopeptide (TPR) repeat protein
MKSDERGESRCIRRAEKNLCHEFYLMYPSEVDWMSAIRSNVLGVYQYYKLDEYSMALSSYEQALQTWSDHTNDEELNAYLQMGILHSEIAEFLQNPPEDKDRTLKHYNSAIENFEKALSNCLISQCEKLRIYYDIASCYTNKIKINDGNKKNDSLMFIKYRELYIENLFIRESDTIAYCLEDIAEVSADIGEHDNAITAYEKALSIRQVLLAENEQDSYNYERNIYQILRTLKNLVELYGSCKQNNNVALKYQSDILEYKAKLLMKNNDQ